MLLLLLRRVFIVQEMFFFSVIGGRHVADRMMYCIYNMLYAIEIKYGAPQKIAVANAMP